jgi:stage II sporulation protein D
VTRAAVALLAALPLAAQTAVKVRQGASTLSLPLEQYVAGVLAGESSVFRSPEALKAMAVAARTYAVRLRGRHAAEGFDFCATTHCQRLDLAAVTPRLRTIAQETAGELLWFEGKPAFACYTRDCGGRTEDAAAVWPDLAAPYLKSRADPYCVRAGGSAWQWTGDPQQIANVLMRSGLRTPAVVERIAIGERTASGRARTLLLSGRGESVRISAGSFRFAIGRGLGWSTIRSDRYEVHGLRFEGAGAGHGVGLCQNGAERMGLEGRTYHEILAFYYPGTVPGITGRGLSWQRLDGDSIALFTTRPDRDRAVPASAERLLREAAARTGLDAPRNLEIRLYPDVETFRNATGEPGWVAARTRGRRIDLQPAGAVEPTLRHELLHAIVESHAAPGLPAWFREGLVAWFEGARPRIHNASPPSDSELQQRTDSARARRAAAAAAGTVASLVERYGLGTVVGWLKTGLPPELMKTSNSHATVNSR